MKLLYEWVKLTLDNVPKGDEKVIIRNALTGDTINQKFGSQLKMWIEDYPDISVEYLTLHEVDYEKREMNYMMYVEGLNKKIESMRTALDEIMKLSNWDYSETNDKKIKIYELASEGLKTLNQ